MGPSLIEVGGPCDTGSDSPVLGTAELAGLAGGRLVGRGNDFSHIPIIDVGDLVAGRPGQAAVAARLGEAGRDSGFFLVVGRGVDEGLLGRLRDFSREFFAQGVEEKLKVRMSLGGRAWRGYFR